MNNKLSMTFQRIFSVALFIIFAVLLTTTTVQSADTVVDPTLKLVKTVINDNGGTATAANFQAYIDDSPVPWDAPQLLSAGSTYTASEDTLPGYSKSVWGTDCAENGTISLFLYDIAECTITNDDEPPSLTLVKIVTNDHSGTAVATDWTLTATGPTTISGPGGVVSGPTFAAGIYTLSESGGPLTGYSASAWSCIGGTQIGNQITLGLGESATCTITNNDVGFNITPTSGLLTSESGVPLPTATFSVALDTLPTADVTLFLSSSNTNEGTIDKTSLTFTPINWSTSQLVTITGVDDCIADGDQVYMIITGPVSTSDGDYGLLDPVADIPDVSVTNYDAPAIGWVEPVGTEGIFFSDGFSPISLEVVSICPEPISKVRFYRWVEAIHDWVTIGEDLTAPYQEVLLPDELEPVWNQVFAFAFSPPNPVQTFSIHQRILILMDFDTLVYLPQVYK